MLAPNPWIFSYFAEILGSWRLGCIAQENEENSDAEKDNWKRILHIALFTRLNLLPGIRWFAPPTGNELR
jgi:hypothetical protein